MYKINVIRREDSIDIEYLSSLPPIVGDELMVNGFTYIVDRRVLPIDVPNFVIIYLKDRY